MKEKICIFWVFCVALILVLSTSDNLYAKVTMSAVADKQEITMDDNVVLSVTLTIENEDINQLKVGRIQFPDSKDFEVVGESSQNRFSSVNGRITRSYQTIFSLMPTHAGKLLIPPIKNFYIKKYGQKVDLETPPIDILVKKVIEEEKTPEKHKELTPPPLLPKSPTSFLLKVVLLTILFILVITSVIFYLFKKSDSKIGGDEDTFDLKLEKNSIAEQIRERDEEKKKEAYNYDDLSRERLMLISRKSEKEFMREISKLVRQLLEQATSKSFANKTSSEIEEELDYLRLGGEAKEIVRDLIETCDMVNYCGSSITLDEMEEMVEKLRRFEQLGRN